ncbi:hypothetical protein [Gynuella sunshinyii]|uniref:Uncharacterized protein n=1 Tax=Gynuella sunshinyii YC6258 TaxID=1445510 RepID=A0A0C5VUL4_9GAMM|nr:hypothetical protein [Gynuella sunshinyii]AJQ97841.1 hypothetical Protein YC6258_05813 [Gynuella sunshinyii YC6258]
MNEEENMLDQTTLIGQWPEQETGKFPRFYTIMLMSPRKMAAVLMPIKSKSYRQQFRPGRLPRT